MMMLSKRLFFTTLAAMTLSLGASAMSQSSQESKAIKKDKPILECPTEVQKLCDQFSQIDVGQTAQCDQLDVSQSSLCGKSDQIDVGSSCSSSSQAQYGACIKQSECAHQASQYDEFAKHVGPKQTTQSWYVNKQNIGHKVHYTNWSGSQWSNVRMENMRIKRAQSYGSKWNNVWVHGNFKHWKFDNAQIRNTTFSGYYRDVDFNGALLEDVDFVKAKFKQKHLRRSNFDGATLRNVRFIDSRLGGMTFRHAYLDNVSLDCSKLKDWNCFVGASILRRDGQWYELTAQDLRGMGGKVSCKQGAIINFTQLFH